MKIRFKLYFVLSVLVGSSVFAQDIHFSQYMLSPLSLNPGNTGNYVGDWRLMANYKSQWREIQKAYRTFSLGGDMHFWPANQQVSAGIYFINDKSGGNLNVNKIYLSGAFHKKIKGFNVGLGIQPGIVLKNIDFYAHSYPEQMNWNTGQFDNTLANTETNVAQNTAYFDLNFGLVASKRFGKIEPGIGVAFFHVNMPKETFIAGANRLTMRQLYHANAKYYFNEKVSLELYTMVDATTKASDWVTGLNAEYVLANHGDYYNALFAGFMWRNGFGTNSDAGIATVGIKYKRYTFGISYDINISSLHTATQYKGGFEFALIYTAKNTHIVKKQIPCDRY